MISADFIRQARFFFWGAPSVQVLIVRPGIPRRIINRKSFKVDLVPSGMCSPFSTHYDLICVEGRYSAETVRHFDQMYFCVFRVVFVAYNHEDTIQVLSRSDRQFPKLFSVFVAEPADVFLQKTCFELGRAFALEHYNFD
ncbi:MAG: hypothetical protein JNN11_04185 [Candidatus Doudnabacteria bacterium]|nr:hypothetical protein [Candidatus Doudnabacteria bacterium]